MTATQLLFVNYDEMLYVIMRCYFELDEELNAECKAKFQHKYFSYLSSLSEVATVIICFFTLLPIGTTACIELKRFEEAITWCDKGLAVSFEGIFHF